MANMEIDVYDIEGNKIEKMALDSRIFEVNIKPEIIHQVVINYLACQRQGNACAKSRAEVRGGGKKPWKQKGTGRARAGSSRSPLWKGGGVIFAKKPRDFSYELPVKVRRMALKAALTSKAQNNQIIVINNFVIDQPKTKQMVKILDKFAVKKPLLLIDKDQDSIRTASRNISKVRICPCSQINTYFVLDCDKIILGKQSLLALQESLIK